MRIVMLADTHGFHQDVKVPDGDLLIFAGDVTMRGNRDELRDFAEWANALPHEHKLIIAGNHDFCFKHYTEESIEIVSPMTYLEDESVEINGVSFWGTPWTPPFGNWAFMKEELELEKIFDSVPQVDVLISHGPPKGVLDRTVREGINVGSDALWRIPTPKIHVFGHIHEARGSFMDSDCTYINASTVNFHYEAIHEPVIMRV